MYVHSFQVADPVPCSCSLATTTSIAFYSAFTTVVEQMEETKSITRRVGTFQKHARRCCSRSLIVLSLDNDETNILRGERFTTSTICELLLGDMFLQ